MPDPDLVTIAVPRDWLRIRLTFPAKLNDRMHRLMERNSEGTIAPEELAELEYLVAVAQISHVINLVLQLHGAPLPTV
jgi:hypothetical protein